MSEDLSRRSIRRRPFLLALAGGGAALTGIGVAARTGVLSGGGDSERPRSGVLRLAGGDGAIPSLELRLTDDLLVAEGKRRWVSEPLPTSTFSMVGVTWLRDEAAPVVEVSARVAGGWKPWQPMPHAHEPTASVEGTRTAGTDVAWTGPADGIRVRVVGSRPRGLALVLLNPEPLPTDEVVAPPAPTGGVGIASATRSPLKPHMFRRRDWGANERWRDGTADYNRTIKQVHVHHTVNSNDYGRKDVPAMIRGMYAYHTKNLGWSDIGYNFLVDRFGRIWIGRAGGAKRPVRGAHTLGFNGTSTGVAVIGNYDVVQPSRKVIGAVARLAAWKLHRYGRDPEGRVRVKSEGSDRYSYGRKVTLPTIDGHRDTNETACPGKHLYAALPRIRRRAAKRIRHFERG
jgi:hypothetical protein